MKTPIGPTNRIQPEDVPTSKQIAIVPIMYTMHKNRYFRLSLAVFCVFFPRFATADDTVPVEWGNAPGLAEPHPDSKGREGYWWWPRTRDEDGSAVPTGGNRGRVFGAWAKLSSLEAADRVPPPPDVPRTITCGPMLIRINSILFEFDLAELRDAGKAEADKLIAETKKYQGDTAICVGHTDDVGPEEYNFQLGLRRAQAVKDYMVENGIAERRIGVRSHGETMPAVPNDSKARRVLNRRVEFDITLGN